ncbi:MAG: ABC transporter substrate-binding protein [Myxococcaceae bacterium]|nr:ABC transporter substrate-binding protein [Myxococcaceae bacterium]
MLRLPLLLLVLSSLARAETLTAYTALDRGEAAAYFEAFTRDTGVQVRWVRLSSGETLARVRAEKERPQASLWFGGPSLDLSVAAADGLLEPYTPKTLDTFRPGQRDAQWRWVGFSVGVLAFASNPEVLARKKADLPHAWSDLLQPPYANEVSMAYAYTSGTAYTVLATVAQLFGEEKAVAYFAALDKNVHHYTRSGAACVTQVGLAEVGTCIAFAHDILNKGKAKGYPVELSFPAEGTGYEVASMAVIAGAPQRELAQRFVDWAVSQPVQATLQRYHRLPVRDDVPRPSSLPADLKLIDFDTEKAIARRRPLIDAWREATGQ